MNWFLSRRASGSASRGKAKQPPLRRRTARLEQLEGRSLLAALPFGAMPDDTGEYMLGDVLVSVVLFESNPAISPGDNNTPPAGGIDAPAENWTAGTIAAVKSNIEQGLQWWEKTLDDLPGVREGLLDFEIDWTFADAPVQTGYEPIARTSNEFVLWMYDFLNVVGFNQTGNFSTDVRAYNNFKRQQSGKDWAFTIFVVNNEVDQDNVFAPGGQFSKAFSFAGGRFMVVPADRPASTFAHEAAHMFWALDEYAGTTSNYLSSRGYYNTPNTNHDSNPTEGHVQQTSIMAGAGLLETAYAGNVTSQSSMEMIGWKDTDGDGIFDVLDKAFLLEGLGRYDQASETYLFSGQSAVRTVPNRNPSGLQNDITINQIREIQYAIDDGPWTISKTLPARTYETAVNLAIPLSPGDHTIRIRTVDTRTGVMSPEFIGTTSFPQSTPSPGGIDGYVYRDDNASGSWDAGEPPLPDWALDLVDEEGVELELRRRIEPSEYTELTLLNNIHQDVVLKAVGSEVSGPDVRASTTSSATGAGKVFSHNSITHGANTESWSANRQLRIDFSIPVSSLSIKAYGGFGRLEAYSASGELLERYTTSGLGSETMTIRRAAGDIAYAIARGHAGSTVVLDTLQWGPAASATSNTQGAYSLSSLPAGTYHLKINPPPNHTVTTFPGGIATFSLSQGGSVSNVNFGIAIRENPWHNLGWAFNVNNDLNGDISPIDALLVINWLNANPGNSLLPEVATPEMSGYIDVNNDGYCSPIDALLVINHLNAASAPPATQSLQQSSGPGFIAPTNDPAAEGETPPQNAAEYYARQPLHFLEIPGADLDCVHDHDEEGHDAAHLEHHDVHESDAVFVTPSAPSLLSLLDAGTISSTFHTVRERLAEARDATWTDRLPRNLPPALARRLERIEAATETAADDLERTLDEISADVSDAWEAALKRALRRRPNDLS